MGNKEAIEKIFNSMTRSKKIHEAVLLVENSKGDFSISCGFNGKTIQSQFFTASVSKLFVTACILILQEQKLLSLDDNIGKYIDKKFLDRLHVYKNKEYSYNLKISDLLFQTSGLSDWFVDGGAKKIFIQRDFEFSFETILEKTKTLHPRFTPNTGKKAYYAEINFIFLVRIVEKLSGLTIDKAYKNFIFTPLGLEKTYLPRKSEEFIPNIYYKNELLYRSQFLTSNSNYIVVSTAADLMTFLKAFWNGNLFQSRIFEKLSAYKKLQVYYGPIYYGGGYMQIPLKSIYTLFLGKGELIGHSGVTGSFAFYYPERDLFFVGDFNQMANPGLPIRLIMKLAMSVK